MFINKQEYLCALKIMQVLQNKCQRMYGRATPNDHPVPSLTFEEIGDKRLYFQSPMLLDLEERGFCHKRGDGLDVKRVYANTPIKEFIHDYYN